MIPVQDWVVRLATQLQVARVGRNPEGVHQARVATRRIQAWLRIAGMEVLADDLRWVRAAMGADRDLHVFLATKPEEPLRSWLRVQKKRARERVRAVVDDARTGALLQALALLRPLPMARAELGVHREFERVRRDGQNFELNPTDEEALHRLRRHIKSLRYCLDFLGVERPSLRALQDVFGTGNDAIVALRFLSAYPEQAVVEPLRADLVARIEATRGAALAAWLSHRIDLVV